MTSIALSEKERIVDRQRFGDINPNDWDLSHFISAQNQDEIYRVALNELRSGRKTSHWMWFVFPNLFEVGMKGNALKYSLPSAKCARAYLSHDVLGIRLRDAAMAVLMPSGRNIYEVMGATDAVKLHKSMTLFEHVSPDEGNVFRKVLNKHFAGTANERTFVLLTGDCFTPVRGIGEPIPVDWLPEHLS